MPATKTGSADTSGNQRDSPPGAKAQAAGMSGVRASFEERGLSQEAATLILESWRKCTRKQYDSYLRKWAEYCGREHISTTSPTVEQALNFLTELHQKGAKYSALNTARSALSAFLAPMNGVSFGSHPLTVRLLKGVSETRPSTPRYAETWDVSVVLNFYRCKMPLAHLTLKDLTLKLVILIALVTAQRRQVIHFLDLAHMTKSEEKISFQLTSSVKTSKPGKALPTIHLYKYQDASVCVYRTLECYLQRTKALRQSSLLFIGLVKPHSSVGKETISRWLKNAMKEAGIDVVRYKPHSTRSASTSAACQKTLPMQDILAVAGWSDEHNCQKFYQRQISSQKQFF